MLSLFDTPYQGLLFGGRMEALWIVGQHKHGPWPPHGPWWAPFWTRISRLPESLAPAVPQGAKLEPDQIIGQFYFSL